MANSGVTFFSFSFFVQNVEGFLYKASSTIMDWRIKRKKIHPPPERKPHYLKTNIFILVGNWGNCILKTV